MDKSGTQSHMCFFIMICSYNYIVVVHTLKVWVHIILCVCVLVLVTWLFALV